MLSSTSYTPDEDFMVLVNALDIYDSDSATRQSIQVVVTGRGPLREFYDQIFCNRNMKWTKVNIRQAWLAVDDYPRIVATADIGVCLHLSSSGFDLPMKVVDMFSAHLPCLAIGGYPSISELVHDDGTREDFVGNNSLNGMIFRTSEELASQIKLVLADFDPVSGSQALRTMRRNLSQFTAKENSWEEQWRRVMGDKVFGIKAKA